MSEASEIGPAPREIERVARVVAEAGGRLLVVGGWVRDALRGVDSKDFDLELYGLTTERATALLAGEGFTAPVGRHFAVWRRTRDGIDVGEPRLDPPAQTAVEADPPSIEAALRARDLTVNAMAFDPLSRRLHDPLGGRADLAAGRLRAADATRFGEDPLRVLRVARLAATLEATPEDGLIRLCRDLDLGSLPVERVAGELRRMLLEPARPWRAFEWLRSSGQLEVFAPVADLIGVPQDPVWHPEGDVYVHTGLVVDRAAELAREAPTERREALMWAALCHDLGKPSTTFTDAEGRVRSPGHDVESAALTRRWLTSLRVGEACVAATETLVRHHLAPGSFVSQGAGPRAYRRLARKLAAAGLDVFDLERVARADHLGRTTAEARARRYEAGDRFLARAREAGVEAGPGEDVVRAADWMRAGVAPGPSLGRLLARSRAVQDETGWRDPLRIMDRVRALEEAGEGEGPRRDGNPDASVDASGD